MDCFCIDLDKAAPEVMEFSGVELENDLRAINSRNPMDLQDFDRRIFINDLEADAWLDEYLSLKDKLKNKTFRDSLKKGDYPCMLYKRRYLVLTLMGEKLYTIRHYKKNWQRGQLFNLYDQTIFLTVRLKSIKQLEGNEYRYDFELLK